MNSGLSFVQPDRWPAVFHSPRFWVTTVLVLAGLAVLYYQIDIEQVHAKARELPGWLCILLLIVLPLVGFPASVLHVGAGLRFGVLPGLALVWLSIFLQLLASYGLVHWNRAFFSRRFKSLRKRIPPGAHAPVTVFTMLIPGAPYCAQNYILPVIGVPLRPYLAISFPIHAVRAIIGVILGGQSRALTLGWVLAMLVYGAALLLVSWWGLRRLQAALGDQPPAAGGRKQPA